MSCLWSPGPDRVLADLEMFTDLHTLMIAPSMKHSVGDFSFYFSFM